MVKRRCSKEDCHAPEDFCQEFGAPLHEQCTYFGQADPQNTQPKTNKTRDFKAIPWTGEWLEPDNLDLLSHRGTPKIIGLVGSSGAGKTTYLAMLYSLLFNGKRIERWDFAGSITLEGWELQAKTLQVRENGTVRNPDATPSDKDFYSLYHLALRNHNFLHDILFADSSGEVFMKWADNINDPAAENARWIYKNSHSFLFFVDCEAIIYQRGRAKRDIVQLAEQVKKKLNDRPVIVVWSKADLADQMRKERKTVVESLERRLSEIFPGATSIKISNYSKSDSDQLCHINNIRVAETVLKQMTQIKPLRISPRSLATDDFFYLYRGNYGSE